MEIDSLSALNAIVGFCATDETWPHPLADLGFKAFFTEKEITVELDGQPRTVVTDLLLASADECHAICLELKSSRLEQDQLDKYLAIESYDLYDQGLVDPQISRNSLTHDVTYVSHSGNSKVLMRRLPSSVPLVVGNRETFVQVQGVSTCQALQQVLSDGIRVEDNAWPTSYIRFTADTEDDIPILQSTLAALASQIILGGTFSEQAISEEAVPHWEMCGAQEKSTLTNRIKRLVNEAANSELGIYIERQTKQQGGGWRCKQMPINYPQSLVKLRRLIDEHLQRKVEDRPYNPPRPGQRDIEELRGV